ECPASAFPRGSRPGHWCRGEISPPALRDNRAGVEVLLDFGIGLVVVRREPDLAFPGAELAPLRLFPGRTDGHQPHLGRAGAGNDDLLAALHRFDQPGEAGFRLMDIYLNGQWLILG